MIRLAYRLLGAAVLGRTASRGPAPLARALARRAIYRHTARLTRKVLRP